MKGTTLWFNIDKGHGFVWTEEDERLYVARNGFLPDHQPERRCKGRVVCASSARSRTASHAPSTSLSSRRRIRAERVSA